MCNVHSKLLLRLQARCGAVDGRRRRQAAEQGLSYAFEAVQMIDTRAHGSVC